MGFSVIQEELCSVVRVDASALDNNSNHFPSKEELTVTPERTSSHIFLAAIRNQRLRVVFRSESERRPTLLGRNGFSAVRLISCGLMFSSISLCFVFNPQSTSHWFWFVSGFEKKYADDVRSKRELAMAR